MTTVGQVNLFNPILNNIDRTETKRYAGMGRSIHFPESIISEACSIVMLEKHIKTVWTMYEYDCISGCINGDYKIASKELLKHLSCSKRVILMAATVGEGVEVASKKYFEQGEYALGLLIDAAATAAVEQAANALCTMLTAQFINQGITLTARFSPGYGDWSLEEQEKVAPLAHGKIKLLLSTEEFTINSKEAYVRLRVKDFEVVDNDFAQLIVETMGTKLIMSIINAIFNETVLEKEDFTCNYYDSVLEVHFTQLVQNSKIVQISFMDKNILNFVQFVALIPTESGLLVKSNLRN